MHGSTSRCASCGLVPLAEGGATVGTPSLTQCEAEEEPQGEEEDGTQDPQASEVVLQDTDSAGRTASDHHYRGLDDGVRPRIGLLGYSRAHLSRRVPLAVGVGVGRRGRLGDGPVSVLRLRLLRAILVSPGDGVVGGRSVLKKRFAVHHLTRRDACSTRPVSLSLNLINSETAGGGGEGKGSKLNSGDLSSVGPESRAALVDAQWRQKQRKQRKDAAPK